MSISRRVEKELSVLLRSTLRSEKRSASVRRAESQQAKAYWSFDVALLGQRRKHTMLEMREPMATMRRT